MFGFTCMPSRKPNKFRLSGVLSEQCLDLLAACVPSCLVYMFIHVTNRTLCWSSYRCDDSLLSFATCSTDVLHYCTLLYFLISLICMYFRSSDVLFYTYCITYTYYIATYVCMYINFDASPRSTACALIRTSLGLLERSDTSEKRPPNPNFLRFAGAIRHFV